MGHGFLLVHGHCWLQCDYTWARVADFLPTILVVHVPVLRQPKPNSRGHTKSVGVRIPNSRGHAKVWECGSMKVLTPKSQGSMKTKKKEGKKKKKERTHCVTIGIHS